MALYYDLPVFKEVYQMILKIYEGLDYARPDIIIVSSSKNHCQFECIPIVSSSDSREQSHDDKC